ncbi:MAG TPA: ribose-5-phosphate isomerase RpiA [Gemmatimonadales bacterium]|nr:ribose-5-phosphate isomerase RpiA [Gemmatimonadales bacterium]
MAEPRGGDPGAGAPRSAESRAELQRQAAERAVELIEPGMVVGLGSGTTAAFAVRRIGALLRDGALRGVVGVATSALVAREARTLGIPLIGPDDRLAVDITIDGADEVDDNLDLIKGAGGALLREKIVAQASRREVIVVDASKLSPQLGTRARLPVEVVPFGWRAQVEFLDGLGARPVVRCGPGGAPYLTDEGNLVVDCAIGPIPRPAELAAALAVRAGVAAHGLFLGLATDVIAAGEDGVVHMTSASSSRT